MRSIIDVIITATPKAPSFISLYSTAATGSGAAFGSTSGGSGIGASGTMVGSSGTATSTAAAAASWGGDAHDDGDVVEELVESKEEWVLRRTAAFNKRLRETPRDVQLWRAFIAFQDEIFDQVMLRGT